MSPPYWKSLSGAPQSLQGQVSFALPALILSLYTGPISHMPSPVSLKKDHLHLPSRSLCSYSFLSNYLASTDTPFKSYLKYDTLPLNPSLTTPSLPRVLTRPALMPTLSSVAVSSIPSCVYLCLSPSTMCFPSASTGLQGRKSGFI